MRAVAGWLVGVVAAGLLLTGCSAEPDDAATLPSITASPTPTPATVTETPTADAPLVAEIERFMAEYYAANDAGYRSQEGLAAWDELFTDNCAICSGSYRTAEDFLNKGYVVEGGEYTNWRLTVDIIRDNQAVVFSTVDVTPATVRSGNQVVRTFDAVQDASEQYTLSRQTNGEWVIVQGEAL